jgi:hypothetical protein
MNKIKIFKGDDITKVEQEVNDFCAGKNVFATQHSTALTSGGGMYKYVITFVVFFKE